MSFFRRWKRGIESLERGWQFYSRPTTLEPPGMVFRLDSSKRKFLVKGLPVEITEGIEADVSTEREIETTAGIIARFLGIKSFNAKAGAGRIKCLKFSMSDPIRHVTTDYAIRDVIMEFFHELDWRERNRYFVIRDARQATAVKYSVSKALFADIGGEAAINQAINAGANIKMHIKDTVEINQEFRERMYVMFLAEEIKQPKIGIAAAPERERVKILHPVNEVLKWEDSEIEIS